MSDHAFNSPELAGFKPEDWAYLGLWKEDLFAAWFWQDWYRKEFAESVGLDMRECSMFALCGGHVFYNVPERNRLREVMRDLVERHDPFFEKYEHAARNACQDALNFALEVPAYEPTLENFERLVSVVRRLMFYWSASASQIAYVLEEVFLEQVVKESIAPDVVAGLIVIDTPLYRQQEELKQLAREINGRSLAEVEADSELFAKLEDHRKRYGWIEMANWIGEELTLPRLLDMISNVSLDEAAHEQPPVSDNVRHLLRCLTAIGYGKQGCAEYVSMLHLHARPFLLRVADRFGVSYRELMSLNHDEIRAGLTGALTPEELQARIEKRADRKWAVRADAEGKAHFIDDPEDIRYLETFIPKVGSGTTELKGQIANKGNVQGRAKVIMNLDEFGKMEQGDVLVTTMTTPDFVLLMQRSCAIVTDIGGMLSHAAIVSREMKKPCIIGTKFATQVFKDGDLLEVDANTGMVRVLERAG
ncbi:MAG: pyruvate, water dikinase [Parcubacteria bacterium C7867-004]|nr:MAG: pyruvate, water dikinase [Parcubacteria bacterium C7867-004]